MVEYPLEIIDYIQYLYVEAYHSLEYSRLIYQLAEGVLLCCKECVGIGEDHCMVGSC